MPSDSKAGPAAKRLQDEHRRKGADTDRTRKRLFGRLLAVTAVLAILLMLPRISEPGPRGDGLDTPPPELVGTWTSSDAPYADRSIEIGAFTVTLGLGGELTEAYPILSTRLWAEQGATVYLITYESVDGEMELEVHLADDGSLTLRNPPQIRWTESPSI